MMVLLHLLHIVRCVEIMVTSVEQAKSVGKTLIASTIKVHMLFEYKDCFIMCILYVSLFCECDHQHSPVILFPHKGNAIVARDNSTSGGVAGCAPWADSNLDRVRMVGAHFVTIRLALNSTFRPNCQQKFNFWAASQRKLPSSSTLLALRYVPSPYHATTVSQLWATGGKY
jgi:hypothetical protein